MRYIFPAIILTFVFALGMHAQPEAGYETVDFRQVYALVTGSVTVDDYKGTSINLAFGPEDAETPAEYYTSDASVHAYAGNTIAITGSEDIKDVVIDYLEGSADISIESERAVVRFSGNCRFSSITVSYRSLCRETSNGRFGTVCAPYRIAVSGATLYSASLSSDNASLVLREVKETVAGAPYIYLATDDNQIFSCIGSSVDEPVDAGCLVGTFENIYAPDGSYILQTHVDEDNNRVQKFYLVDTSVAQPRVTANKAYLVLPAADSDAEAKSVAISTGESAAISAVDALVGGEARIYDVNGRRLSQLQKGVNIVNGVKVLVK